MLLALLLSVLPTVVPLVICQDPAPVTVAEPDLRWDGETEDAFRRALHLWAVRGKPGEAADILLSLADKPEVTQIAGQASWVLVLAAQALVETGRADEAAALIPGIERGARGTQLEAAVGQRLAELRATAEFTSQGLDMAFLETLIRQLSTTAEGDKPGVLEAGLFNGVRKYDRPVLPYLLEMVRIWPEAKIESVAVGRAILIGLSMADAAFVDELYAILEEQSTLSFITIMNTRPGQALDEVAEREASRFWKALATHREERRRILAREALRSLAFDSNSTFAQQVVRDLLGDNDSADDPVLLKFPGSGSFIESPSDPRSQLLRTIALGPDSPAADQARNLLCHPSYFDQLRELANRGERKSVVRYLACIAATSLPNSIINPDIGGYYVVNRIFQMEGINRGTPNWRGDESKYKALVLEQPRAFEFARPFLADASIRTLLALAAIGLKDDSAFELAYAFGIPDDEASLCFTLYSQDWLPQPFRPRAPQFLSHSELDTTAWNLLSNRAPELITVESMQSASSKLRREYLDDTADLMLKQGRSREVFQLLGFEGVTDDTRFGLLTRYVLLGESWWRSLDDIQALLVDMKPEYLNTMYINIGSQLGNLSTAAVAELDVDIVALFLIAAHKTRSDFRSTTLLTVHWTSFGHKLMLKLGSSDELVEWLSNGLRHPAPDFVVHCLAKGTSLASFNDIQSNPGRWFPDGSPQLIEAARILLARNDPAAIHTALNMMFLAPSLAPALWKEVEFAWSDPALASLTANVLQQTSQRDDYVQKLMEAWRLPGLQKRLMMVEAMSSAADPRMAPLLLEAIADPDGQVANAARYGLNRLKELEEQRAFWESWQATGVGGSPTAALLKQIQSKNKEVRLSAIRALGAIKAPEALPLLISLLEDPDPEVVAAARAGLTWLNPENTPK